MRVAIVGLGIAGLRTAMLLEEAGVELTLFEARDRVGGRLHTVATDGGWYEAGGEWIDSDHSRVLGLLREFGLEPEPSDPRPGKLVFNGDVCRDDDLWPDAEQDSAYARAEAHRLARQLADHSWANPPDLDRSTVADFFDRQATTRRGRWLLEAVTRSDEGDDTDRLSLLGWLVGQRQYLARSAANAEMSSHRFPTGGEGLCRAMAERLRAEPQFGRVLKAVQQSEDHVELWFPEEVALADRVVVAVPPGPLRRVEFEPDWPEERARALEAMGRAPIVKVALEFDARFWESPATSGGLMADLPFQQVWVGGRGGAPVLLAYVVGRQAEAFASDHEAAVQTVLRALAEALPGAVEAFRGGRVHDWVSDPFAQCGFSALTPGAVFDSLPWLREQWGRVHFAGEHTADWLGFVEGALESAERVAKEVLDAD